MDMIKSKYSSLLAQDHNAGQDLLILNGEQSNYLSDSSKHQSQFRDCLTFCGSRFKSLNEKRDQTGLPSHGDSMITTDTGIANIGSAFRSALASIPQENSVASPSKETVIETGAQQHQGVNSDNKITVGTATNNPVKMSSMNLATSSPSHMNFGIVAQHKASMVMSEEIYTNPRGPMKVRGDIVSPVNRGGHANNGKLGLLKQVNVPLLIGIGAGKDKSSEPSPAKTVKGVQSSKTFIDGYKVPANEGWKNNMVTIDDLQESCSSPSDVEDDEEYQEDVEKLTVMKIDPARFPDKRVQFMLRVYKGKPENGYTGITVPKLEINRINQQLTSIEPTTIMSRISKKSEAYKKFSIKNPSVIEQIFIEKFILFIRSAFSQDEKVQEYMMDNFSDLYEAHGDKEPSIERVLMILKSLADCRFNLGTESPQSCSSGQPLDKKSLLILHHINPEEQPRNLPVSRVGTIDPSPSVITRMYKAQLTSTEVDEVRIPLKSYQERVGDSFKYLTSLENCFKNKTKLGFAYFYENMDLHNEYPTRSNTDSPAKSARSINTTKRKKRAKELPCGLQMEMITLKNTKMVHIRNFDNDLQKMLRPTYIFEDEVLPLFKHNLDYLILNEQQKFQLVEFFYFHPDKMLTIMKKYEFDRFNHEFLNEVRAALKKYSKWPKSMNKIKLTFEETLTYLNRVELINDYGFNLFTNLFKYDNELVNAIYEIFIMTRNLSEFLENFKILKHSGYYKTEGAQADMNKAEKSYNLGQGILSYVNELFKVYYSLEERRVIKKLIHEANEDLINFSKQNEHLTTKFSQTHTFYLGFNNQLRQFLELKKNKYGYGRKMSIKTESVFQWRGQADKEANKTAYDEFLRTQEFRVCLVSYLENQQLRR